MVACLLFTCSFMTYIMISQLLRSDQEIAHKMAHTFNCFVHGQPFNNIINICTDMPAGWSCNMMAKGTLERHLIDQINSLPLPTCRYCSGDFIQLFLWKFPWLPIKIPHKNSCTLKIKIYVILATHRDICLGARTVGVNGRAI